MKNKNILALILLVLLMPVVVVAEPASSDSVKAMMKRTGAGDIGVQVLNQIIPAMKKMMPQASDKFWNDIMADVDANQLVEMVVPVYQKYLSQEDIEVMNAFYNSSTGKKLVKIQPAIMQESMQLGQQWGKDVARKIMMKYKEQSE